MLPTCQNAGRHAVYWWLQDSGLPGDDLWRVRGQVKGEPQTCGFLSGGRREAEPGAQPGSHLYRLHLPLWQLYYAGGRELPAPGQWPAPVSSFDHFKRRKVIGHCFLSVPRCWDIWLSSSWKRVTTLGAFCGGEPVPSASFSSSSPRACTQPSSSSPPPSTNPLCSCWWKTKTTLRSTRPKWPSASLRPSRNALERRAPRATNKGCRRPWRQMKPSW